MLILGSASATRAKILRSRGILFEQATCDFDEDTLDHTVPKNFVYHAAMGKMKACEEKFGLKRPILTADTVVTAKGMILRKAKSEEEARHFLKMQSGSSISIMTCMIYKSESKMFIDLSATHYTFDRFDEEEMERYMKSGEWRGKAGACMVEGFCQPYILSVKGYESCAMGLTVEKLEPWLDV